MGNFRIGERGLSVVPLIQKAMTSRDHFIFLMVVLLLLGAAKLAHQLYRFYDSRDERIEIARLEGDIEDAGFGVISTQLKADSLRRAIESIDEELRGSRVEIDELETRLLDRSPTSAEERTYRELLDAYNARVDERNALYRDWRVSVDSNRTYVRRYNGIVDSIRAVATALGEPYYPVLSPAEIANQRRSVPGQ